VMFDPSDLVTIRRLPDGEAHSARIANRAPGWLALAPLGDQTGAGFDAGALVEIDGPEAMYLGEVTGRQKDSLVTVAVAHFVDRAALAQIEKVWGTAQGA
jgi:hypothetical protein